MFARAFGDALVTIAIGAFVLGVVATIAAWALWHFLLCHIHVAWMGT